MELPKETIERIEKQCPYGAGWHTWIEGAKSEALRSLSEIEKLKEAYNSMDAAVHLFNNKAMALESQNKELMEALRGIANSCDNQNPTHETIWRIAESLLKNLPNKEA